MSSPLFDPPEADSNLPRRPSSRRLCVSRAKRRGQTPAEGGPGGARSHAQLKASMASGVDRIAALHGIVQRRDKETCAPLGALRFVLPS